jgi:hypothetical protein
MIDNILDKYGLSVYKEKLRNTKDATMHAMFWSEMLLEVEDQFEDLLIDLAINNDYISLKGYPYLLNSIPNNESVPLFFLLLQIHRIDIDKNVLIDFGNKYKSEIAPILKLAPFNIEELPLEFVNTLSKDIDWNHFVVNFDEYQSRKSNDKFKKIITEFKKDLFLEGNSNKTYKPVEEKHFIKLLLLGLTLEEDEIRDIFDYNTSLRKVAKDVLKDLYILDSIEFMKKYPIDKPKHILKYNDILDFKSYLEQIEAADLKLQLAL